jgi:hypothetical protein
VHKGEIWGWYGQATKRRNPNNHAGFSVIFLIATRFQNWTWCRRRDSEGCDYGCPPPLSCIPPVVMQKASQGPNWTENADNADEAEIN